MKTIKILVLTTFLTSVSALANETIKELDFTIVKDITDTIHISVNTILDNRKNIENTFMMGKKYNISLQVVYKF